MENIGRIFVFGDDIDTDQLAPGQYMKGGIDKMAAHCLESVRPEFARQVSAGDYLVAGRNFGMGSSREQAAQVLIHLGVQAVIAQSFGGIFYRNAINLGLPALLAPSTHMINDGDSATMSLEQVRLSVIKPMAPNSKTSVPLLPVAENIQQILDDGGLVAHLKKRIDREKLKTSS
jgi:3-isopropylmalate/(R)-2-methylmalate dehydratase small subunit